MTRSASFERQADPPLTRGVQAHLVRAVPLGLFIGLMILVTQTLLLALAFNVFTASDTIEGAAATYIKARLWGLPATLGSIALMGWFVGISRSGRALSMQIVLNLVNLILSPLFVISFGWGLYGKRSQALPSGRVIKQGLSGLLD